MKIAIFGMGYVGFTSALCLRSMGHDVVGIDNDTKKIYSLVSGNVLLTEPKIIELQKKFENDKQLTFTSNYKKAANDVNVILVCVGTPSNSDGSLNLMYIKSVSDDIANLIRRNKKITKPEIVVRSTILPGTCEQVIIPILESKGLIDGEDYNLSFHPEFLREGSAVNDFFDPPKIVFGNNKQSKSKFAEVYNSSLFSKKPIFTNLRISECVKYVDNIFHALKVTFANEVGDFCKSTDIDAEEVMAIFKQDKKLNISEYYLNPGYAYGGSCLPKDLDAFLSEATEKKVDLKLISNIKESNNLRIENRIKSLLNIVEDKLIFFGFAFKKGTNDIRNSPYLATAMGIAHYGKQVLAIDINFSDQEIVEINQTFGSHNLIFSNKYSDLDYANDVVICHKPSQSEESLLKNKRSIQIV